METHSLFSKPKKPAAVKSKKVIACGNEADDQPLIFGLKQGEQLLRFGHSENRFEWISEGAVDIGFISSIDFCRLKGGWHVFPNMCKSSIAKSRIALFFNKNLNEIRTIAVPSNSNTSRMVLQVLLKELYQIDSRLVKSDLGLESALLKYDAVLLTGNNALIETSRDPNAAFIDLGEDWYDLTSLPLVYGFWIGNELTTDKGDYFVLKSSLDNGVKSIENIISTISTSEEQSNYRIYLSERIMYNLGNEEKEALDQLYQYAFYYGLVEFIPDFNFLKI